MKITRQITAEKIADYLHGKLSQPEWSDWASDMAGKAARVAVEDAGAAEIQLVDWSERAMMEADFDEKDTELLSDIIGRLGLADVAEFGLRWQAFGREPNFTEGAAERERMRLGNPGNRDSGISISDCEEFLRRLGCRATVTVSTQ